MPNLPPVNKVNGVKNRYSGKHRKGGGYQEVIISFSGDGRVGITSLQNRVIELIRLQRIALINCVLTLIDEV
jgi:hypothetical protein